MRLITDLKTMVEQLQSMERAMKAAELAALLNISRQQVYKLTAAGRVPYFRIANSVRFDPGTIADWLSAKGDSVYRPRINSRRPEYRGEN